MFARPVHTDRVMTSWHPFLAGPFPRAYVHRGWQLDDLRGMENAPTAFARALQEGFRYLETDARATRDGVAVVHHDATLERTTDGVGAVLDRSWTGLRQVRIGGRDPIARLDELLEELPDALLNVDVKDDSAVDPVLRVLERMRAFDRVCLASFSERRLRRLRKAAGPRLLTSLGVAGSVALRVRSWLPPVPLPIPARIAQLPTRRGPVRAVDRRLVRHAHRRGMEVHVWTVNRTEEMDELLGMGVDGLITDRPDLLRDVLRRRGQWQE